MIAITKDNVDELLDNRKLYAAIMLPDRTRAAGFTVRWWKLRRNGKTKTWKRDPYRVEVPVKCGLRNTTTLYFSHALPALDPENFRHVDDVPEKDKA